MLSSVLRLVKDSELEERGASIDGRRVKREKTMLLSRARRRRKGQLRKEIKQGRKSGRGGSSGSGWVGFGLMRQEERAGTD